jgi:glycosyltransferase involved in cell wall biosynthesis
MRVLQVIETGGPGGAETVFAALSSGLRGRRHQVTCLVGAGSWLPGEMARRGLPTAVLPDAGRLDATLLATIRDAIRSSAAELVHAHLFDGALYAALAARLEGVPCVVTLHGQVDVADRGISAFVKRTLFRRLAARVVCVSWALRHDVQASLHVAARRCIVIYNGIEGACGQRGGTTRTVHQLASTPWRLVAIGNIRPAKDYPTLLDAVARLRQAGLLVRLDVAGQPDRGGLFGSLLQQVDQLGLRDVVTFHGFLPDPLALLRDAACFVLSSSREGF